MCLASDRYGTDTRLLASHFCRYHRNLGRGVAVRSLLVVTAVSATILAAHNATAQNVFSDMAARMNPAIAAQRDFERSVADYKKCLVDNVGGVNACEGLRHIMDASVAAAGHYNGSR
jgi:hypothetical protein